MKIAIPVTVDNQIDGHFGHCEYYRIFEIAPEGDIMKIRTIPSLHGCGCKSDIAAVLAEDGVTVMLAGGIGGGAINVLNNAGIEVVRGCSGDATVAVKRYLSGSLTDSGESCHQHHEHHHNGHGHQCER